MRRYFLAILTVAAILSGQVGAQSAAQEADNAATFGLDEIRVGQRGHGLTVVRGVTPERFEVELLGVLADSFPGIDLIVARLSGLDLESSGVAAGMSGSPVYVDGRLLGAVAYRLVDFGREAIAGIVPIGNMLELQHREAKRPAPGDEVVAALGEASSLLRGDASGSVSSRNPMPAGVHRIGTPLAVTGFDPRVVARLRPMFESFGWVPTMGGIAGRAQTDFPDPEPGGAIAVQLVRGDINVTATGTVTHVAGNSVYAFGHPFMQLGDVDYPMVSAEIITVLNSQAASQKLSAAGTQVIGALRQDRTPGILGILGHTPQMVPVTVNLTNAGAQRAINFEIVHDPLLTPLYLFFGLVNLMQSVEDVGGPTTIDFRGEIHLDGGFDPVELTALYSQQGQAVVGIASWLSGIFGSLLTNDLRALEVNEVSVDLDLSNEPRVATIERAWTPRRTLRAGDEFPVYVDVRPYRGDRETHSLIARVPENAAEGTIQILVGGAEETARELAATGEDGAPVTSIASLVSLVNAAPKNDRIHVLVSRASRGATVGASAMPGLPPSTLKMLADAGDASSTALTRKLLDRQELIMGRRISGSATLSVQIER